MGARLLCPLSKPPCRLYGRLLERDQLGTSRRACFLKIKKIVMLCTAKRSEKVSEQLPPYAFA